MLTSLKTGRIISTGIWTHNERNAQGYYEVKDCVGTCKANNLDIQVGNVLISRNGRPIQKRPVRDGERLTYVVERNGKRHTVTAVAVSQVLEEVKSLAVPVQESGATDSNELESGGWGDD